MNYALSRPSSFGTARRGGLLGVVLALHAGVLFVILAAKTIAPVLLEVPLIVQFLDPPKPVEVAAAPRPLPVAPPKREITRPERTKAMPTPPRKAPDQPPPLETTTSTEPAPASAPMAAPSVSTASPTPFSGAAGAGSVAGSGDGNVVGARFDADYLQNPAPPYPPQSRRVGEEGKVILRVLVTANGSAQEVEVKTSSGSSRLDDSARKTVRQWKFIPAKRGGAAIESWVLVPIVFKLEQ